MLTQLLTKTCTITTRTASATLDAYGNAEPTETTEDVACELQQRVRSEPGQDGEFSTADFLLILPAGTGIDTGAIVSVDSVSYEVVGAPWPVWNPRLSNASHVECTVRRTAGAGD